MMQAFPVQDSSHIAQVRRDILATAQRIGFDTIEQGRVAIVVTELATNLLKHAGGGILLVENQPAFADPVLDCVALDKGPGMHDIAACLGDGYSTAGSAGSGLGAVLRQADLVDIYSQPQSGTVLFVRLRPGESKGAQPVPASRNPSTARLFSPGKIASGETEGWDVENWGGVCVAKPGEDVSGDNWQVKRRDDGLIAVTVDGLGHGMLAAEAANAALAIFDQHYQRRPAEIINAMHAGMRHTRGAAIGIAHLDRVAQSVHFAGIGNIAAALISAEAGPAQEASALRRGPRRMVSQNGTVGHALRRVQEMDYPFDPVQGGGEAMVIMQSDGIASSWSLDAYPGLTDHHPLTIAATLYRDFRRGRDDATVLVTQVR
ncbi:hypothetical protein ACFPL7_03625 [Dongia soli]|uniref:PPM-type phosphatase domain-containing protein n=1 Tax=Dongia soli TaxID=600628 RepID=A0ABU5EFK0_9PROT|nr:hypothetical protein [Dongia soli]MDY0884619.1 hypothetical protein [Dongia soli]